MLVQLENRKNRTLYSIEVKATPASRSFYINPMMSVGLNQSAAISDFFHRFKSLRAIKNDVCCYFVNVALTDFLHHKSSNDIFSKI